MESAPKLPADLNEIGMRVTKKGENIGAGGAESYEEPLPRPVHHNDNQAPSEKAREEKRKDPLVKRAYESRPDKLQ